MSIDMNVVEELEKLASTYKDKLPIENTNPIPNEITPVDFNITEVEIAKIASEYVDSIIEYSIGDLKDILKDHSLKNKKSMDIRNLQDILYSMFISMHALKKIAVQIETASTSGRLIEGLAAILEKKKNYNQALSQMQEYFRESYSILVSEWKIKNNIVEVYSTPELPAAQDIYNEPKTNVIRGTRDLLNRVKGE